MQVGGGMSGGRQKCVKIWKFGICKLFVNMFKLKNRMMQERGQMVGRATSRPVENSTKNDNKIVQKVIDLSTIGAYNRDNF